MTEPTQSNAVWLTQAKYDELTAELEELRGTTRATIVSGSATPATRATSRRTPATTPPATSSASSTAGSPSSTQMLERAEVGETPADDGVVEPGMKVTANLIGLDMNRSSSSAPARWPATTSSLLAAVPARRGDQRQAARRHRQYEAPNGKKIEVEILEATPYAG